MPVKFLAVGTLFLALVLVAIPNLVWLLLSGLGLLFDFHIRYTPFGWISVSLAALCIIVMSYGFFFGRWLTQVASVEYSSPDVPESFDGYKIVHISDLHLSTFDDKPEQLSKIVETINGLDANLVCFTGDLVTIGVQEAEPYTEVLKGITARDGVASVLGNHDFMLYAFKGRTKKEMETAVNALTRYEQRELCWNLLRNESLTISRGGEKITIVGVDNGNCSNQGFRTINKSDLPKALEGTDGFRILLSHDPSQWETDVVHKTDIPLTLSGHTHAAQVRIFGWTPARWVFRQTDGRYDTAGQTLYINIGLGCTAPVRIGARPEITLITLRRTI